MELPPRPDEMPFLAAISWFDAAPLTLTPAEMLARYERGWRHLGVLGTLEGAEREYVRELVRVHGSYLDVPA